MCNILEKYDIYPYLTENNWIRKPAVIRRTGHVFYKLDIAECKLCSNCNLENCKFCKEEVTPATWEFDDNVWKIRKLLQDAGCSNDELYEYEKQYQLKAIKFPTFEDLQKKRPDLLQIMILPDKRIWAKLDQIAKRVSNFTELRELAIVGESNNEICHVQNQVQAWWEHNRMNESVFGGKKHLNAELQKVNGFGGKKCDK